MMRPSSSPPSTGRVARRRYEAYLRLADERRWENRRHFFAAAQMDGLFLPCSRAVLPLFAACFSGAKGVPYFQTLLDTGMQAQASKEEEWHSLGVFAMIQGERTDSNDLFQLAVNKAGTIRGNFYNVLSDTTLPVYGAVDKNTQRAAWTVGDKKEPIYEAGFANLTKPETTVMVHFGKARSQQWTLIRIEQPAENK
jgi:hypothetical protein